MLVTAKRTTKDTVFRDFFGQPENLIELYRVLHPEDAHATKDMLCNVTIENVLTDQMYNDLGFMVGDRLMILVEAQSTWSVNIIIRAMMYMAQSYQERFEKQGVNLYGSKKIDLPEPELYVIYTGDRKDKPEKLMLSREFFGGKQTAIEVTVKVLYGENLTDVIGQYVRFCKVFNRMTAVHGFTEQAIQETIRICKRENVLKRYLSDHEREVTSIMMALFSAEYIQQAYGREKFNEGIATGKAEGMAKGSDLMAKLSARLAEDGKIDAIIRAGYDDKYRAQLLKEYQLG